MGLREWLYRIALEKALKRGAHLLASFLLAAAAKYGAEQYGVTLDGAKLEAGLVVGAGAGLEFVRNWAKFKFPQLARIL